jgi:hypothetical protein
MTRTVYVSLYALAFAFLLLRIQPSGPGAELTNEDAAARASELHPVEFSDQFFGIHTLSPSRHWPTVSFGDMRPAGVTWGALEPARDQYDWSPLDFWLSQTQAHAVQFDYVFLNVPRWTSIRPDEPCAGKRIGCAAPPDLNDWDNFVRALVTRYKGRISSYELWNEPNASGYWTGTPKEMVDLAAHAYSIIKSIDPSAIVTTPAASSTGWPLTHDAWMNQYLDAGGGKYADVIAWHGYSGRNDRPALPPEELPEQIHALRAVLEKHNLGQMQIWNTEGGWGKNEQLPDANDQASFLIRWYLLQFTHGVSRAYWYQWDNPNWGTLWREGTGMDPAGAAYQQVHNWLEGTTAVTPCRLRPATKLWVCDLLKGTVLYRAAWSTSGETTFPDIDQVESYTDATGGKQNPNGKPVTVGLQPILFRIKGPQTPHSAPGRVP